MLTFSIAIGPDEESSRVLSLLCDVFCNWFLVLDSFDMLVLGEEAKIVPRIQHPRQERQIGMKGAANANLCTEVGT